ncbi:hypothetical protein [Streptomyces alfalfae]|uniref:Uncharacterized protein n=1 Tax=Streptomyces alfalfae TaxID=1642299 RepID=A0A7T4PHV8_9ACTN|nr:hypothetical protein [Streptomyces alfalfae]QQC90578.1 hypothetical protein I8755_20840 [Streptomyces alfalfae]
MLTEERFADVCTEVTWHAKKFLDLIHIHSEQEVRGRQPRATLNPLTVLMAAAAWERFVSDLAGAASYSDEKWGESGASGLGRFQIPKGKKPDGKGAISRPWEPDHLSPYLRQRGVLDRDISDEWAAWLSFTRVGATPKGWSFAEYVQDADAFRDILKEVQKVRNGVAHLAFPQDLATAQASSYSWTNNAKSITIQSGHARGLSAALLQLIDASIVTVARSHRWPIESYRLPAAWFRAKVPGSDSRYPGAEFWGGRSLHRLSS